MPHNFVNLCRVMDEGCVRNCGIIVEITCMSGCRHDTATGGGGGLAVIVSAVSGHLGEMYHNFVVTQTIFVRSFLE